MNYATAPFNAVLHQMDSALTLASAVTENALDGASKMFDVQLRATRASMADVTGGTHQLLGQPLALDWMLSGAKYGQASMAKAFSFANEMATILGLMHGKLAIIAEKGTIQSHKKLIAMMGEQATPSAPANTPAVLPAA